ncbi:MAG: hypothetical protein GW928_06190 [Rhodoferax sp.]|nr:hypothetical protein [Betaproteobacteria bacterium]NCN97034.1 hypothetical protein [Rhodoferax sp.]OIP21590.1 MAG: hypothetical protein AUK50_01065 [Comamonadaceae bacterium CG2_30_57_122]PIZ21807.1 MAG: hypothetical protein COY49_11840 [Comamonadaceae bacterium CG_4_10_14_0_8_um_filter_57_29]PJC14234.1 MAG: hypothetical protein CO065_14730 [Comamonadaceae bacterium CG_4_9_14_0_8_um_filter_57_21]
MSYALLKTLHLLSIIVWIGGMVFANFFLRPAVAALEPAVRVRLMHAVLGRFFTAVLVAAGLAFATGGWMIGRTAADMARSGVRFNMPLEWMLMATLGVLMMLIFVYIRWVLYRRLGALVQAADWPLGGALLQQIRGWVLVNLVLGVVIVLVTVVGVSS